MAIKSYKPTTAGRRGMTVTDYSELSKVAPCKSLLEPLKKNSGRNSYGRITVRHRGGGVRRKYRVIDFKRNKLDMNATVLTIEYDPNRSAFIALVEYLGNKVVCHSLPIRPGRNLAVIVETAAVNHRQKKMGYNAAQELYRRVQANLTKNSEV